MTNLIFLSDGLLNSYSARQHALVVPHREDGLLVVDMKQLYQTGSGHREQTDTYVDSENAA
ncbi:MAG: hypothetical protein FWD57_04870 [Polyangiaceae bacterium]|nr:hypothetical protein [Polyangiaceae bacterium]